MTKNTQTAELEIARKESAAAKSAFMAVVNGERKASRKEYAKLEAASEFWTNKAAFLANAK